MDLETSKILGGIGSLLIVIGSVGSIGGFAGILGLVGLILVLVALKGLAEHYSEGGIFNNAIYGIIIAIVGGVASIAAIFMSALAALAALGIDLSEVTDWSAFATILENSLKNLTNFNTILPFLGAIIVALVVLFVFAIITAIFFRKSLVTLSEKTGVKMFATAGLLMLIGAVLTIVLIGFIIMWVAWILITVAFFSLRTQVS